MRGASGGHLETFLKGLDQRGSSSAAGVARFPILLFWFCLRTDDFVAGGRGELRSFSHVFVNAV